jgi:hypothetical protein
VQCSVSCGEGEQTRSVQCRDARNAPSALCDPVSKPTNAQLCRTGIPCPIYRTGFYDSGKNRQTGLCFMFLLVSWWTFSVPGSKLTSHLLTNNKTCRQSSQSVTISWICPAPYLYVVLKLFCGCLEWNKRNLFPAWISYLILTSHSLVHG